MIFPYTCIHFVLSERGLDKRFLFSLTRVTISPTVLCNLHLHPIVAILPHNHHDCPCGHLLFLCSVPAYHRQTKPLGVIRTQILTLSAPRIHLKSDITWRKSRYTCLGLNSSLSWPLRSPLLMILVSGAHWSFWLFLCQSTCAQVLVHRGRAVQNKLLLPLLK